MVTMGFKSFFRSLAALTFAILFLMGAFARPVLAQSEDDNAASSADSNGQQPTLQLSPGDLAFGNITVGQTSASQTETATNPSTHHKKIKVEGVSVTAGFTVTANACSGSTLRDGEMCTVAIACAPTAAGAITGTLTIKYKTNKKRAATANLTCTGVT